MLHPTFADEAQNTQLCLDMLSPRSRDEITLNYTTEINLPIPEIVKPPTPIDAFNNAMGYLNRVKEQKFLEDFHTEEFERLYYNTQNSSLKQFTSKPAQKTEDDDEIRQDAEIAYWLNTDTYRGFEKELRKLPFKERLFLAKAISKLGNFTVQLAQNIKHEKSKIRKMTIQDEKRFIKYFVEELQAHEWQIIKEALDEDQFYNTKLPKYIIEKFNIVAPKVVTPEVKNIVEIKKKDADIEKIVVENIKSASKRLPDNYRMNPSLGFSQDSIDKILSDTKAEVGQVFKNALDNADKILYPMPKNNDKQQEKKPVKKLAQTTRIMINPNRRRPVTSIAREVIQPKILTHDQVYNNYWDLYDPLKTRSSRLEVLDDMKLISNDIKFIQEDPKFSRKDLCYPFKPEEIDDINDSLDKPIALDGPLLIDKIWNTSDLLRNKIMADDLNTDTVTMDSIKEETPPTTIKILPKPVESSNEEVMKILRAYKPGHSAIDLKAEDIFQRLSKIWNTLGFSAMERLKLVAKYSSSPEETSKLTDALGYWEMAFEKAQYYNKYYHDLRDYLNYESFNYSRFSPILTNLTQEFQRAEIYLAEIAIKLRDVYNDNLIVNSRSYIDLINLRRLKLRKRMELQDIPVPDFMLTDAASLFV